MRKTSAGALMERFGNKHADCIRKDLPGLPIGLAACQVSLGEPMLDLWCLRTTDLPPLFLAHPHQLDLLSASELDRHAAFRFQRDSDIYLAKRILVRGLLSLHAGVHPREWTFATNRFGKPYIAEKCNVPGLHFSLSSSSDLAVCLVTREPISGVDVEDTRKPDASEASGLILSIEERAHIERLPAHERKRAFLQCWTLKEAYLKARGIGLELPLGDITFHLEDPTAITATFSERIVDDPERWRFQDCLLFERYLIAIAICR